jgi:large subunit ribosomal protein L3
MIMVEGIIGIKVGMTQTFDEKGNVIPATVIKAGPCTVVQKKSLEKDGYAVVQLGLVDGKEYNKVIKPVKGHFDKAGIPPLRVLKEFRYSEAGDIKEGAQFFVDIFSVGEKINVVGTSKGKGFAGVIKRYGFKGGKKTHGSMFHRAPGSIGQSAWPSRVIKGKKMPGHMGNAKVSVKNLTVIQADKENNLLVVKGAVPGATGGLLLLKKTNFAPAAGQGKE